MNYDDHIDWANPYDDIAVRLALAMNTLGILGRCASEQPQASFQFKLFAVVQPEEAGFYFPVGNSFVVPYVDFFEYIEGYSDTFEDYRFVLDCLKSVIDGVNQNIKEATSEADFKIASKNLSDKFSNLKRNASKCRRKPEGFEYAEFNFLRDYKNKLNRSGSMTTCEYAAYLMTVFHSALTSKNVWDANISDRTSIERDAHSSWAQRFNSSNIRITPHDHEGRDSYKDYNLDPRIPTWKSLAQRCDH